MSAATSTFARRLLAIALMVMAVLALWYLRHLVLLIFAAILFAIILRAVASFIQHNTGMGDGLSFLGAALTASLAIGLFVYVLGAQLHAQFLELRDQLPELLSPLNTWLEVGDMGEWLAERIEALMSETTILSRIAGLSGWAAALVANLVLVIVAGLYLGFRPELYVRGFLLLFPHGLRHKAARTLVALGSALRRWLLGQVAAMILVGTFTYLGLWLLGIESALALGFIAGVLEFVPFIGPVLAAAPALAIAIGVDVSTALWVLALYLVIQQVEGNVLNPMIQQRAVSLPPAVTLFALLAFGMVFGPLGVLLATPLAVVCLVGANELWVKDAAADEVSRKLPAEHETEDRGSAGKKKSS